MYYVKKKMCSEKKAKVSPSALKAVIFLLWSPMKFYKKYTAQADTRHLTMYRNIKQYRTSSCIESRIAPYNSTARAHARRDFAL